MKIRRVTLNFDAFPYDKKTFYGVKRLFHFYENSQIKCKFSQLLDKTAGFSFSVSKIPTYIKWFIVFHLAIVHCFYFRDIRHVAISPSIRDVS